MRSIGAGTTTLVSRASGAAGEPVEAVGAPSIATVSGSAHAARRLHLPLPGAERRSRSRTSPTCTCAKARRPAGARARPWARPGRRGAGFSGLGGARQGDLARRAVRGVRVVRERLPSPGRAARRPRARARPGDGIDHDRLAGRRAGRVCRSWGEDPTISGDGTKVAFLSREAVVPGVPAGTEQVYVRDLATGTTQLASELEGVAGNSALVPNPRSAATGAGSPSSRKPPTSAAPRTRCTRTTCQTGRHDARQPRDRRRRRAGRRLRATRPSIDADGTHVAFASRRHEPRPQPTKTTTSVGLRARPRHRDHDARERGPGGVPNNKDAFEPVVSGDGSRVAFMSFATNLDPADTTAEHRRLRARPHDGPHYARLPARFADVRSARASTSPKTAARSAWVTHGLAAARRHRQVRRPLRPRSRDAARRR